MALLFLSWVVFSILIAVYADKKGRSAIGFFFLSLLTSPLIGFLVALLVEPHREEAAERSGMKKCPDCGEYVRGEARICRFCRHEFRAVEPEVGITDEGAAPTDSDFDAWSREARAAEPQGQEREDTRRLMRKRLLIALVSLLALGVLGLIFTPVSKWRSNAPLRTQGTPPSTKADERGVANYQSSEKGREKAAWSRGLTLVSELPYPSSTRFRSVVSTPDGWVCFDFFSKGPERHLDHDKEITTPKGGAFASMPGYASVGFAHAWNTHCNARWSLPGISERLEAYARTHLSP